MRLLHVLIIEFKHFVPSVWLSYNCLKLIETNFSNPYILKKNESIFDRNQGSTGKEEAWKE